MHFGKQLKFLAFQPWKDNYIDFAKLKKILKEVIAAAEAQKAASGGGLSSVAGTSVSVIPPQVLSPSPSATDIEASTDIQAIPLVPIVHSPAPTTNATEVAEADHHVATTKDEEEEEFISVVEVVARPETSESPAPEEDTSKPKAALTPELRDMFLQALYAECDKVSSFFSSQLDLCTKEFQAIQLKVTGVDFSLNGYPGAVAPSSSSATDAVAPSEAATKKRFFDLLIVCEELLDFSHLNLIGFTKIVKKFARNTDFGDRAGTMAKISGSAFVKEVTAVEDIKKKVKDFYAETFLESEAQAKIKEKQLKQRSKSSLNMLSSRGGGEKKKPSEEEKKKARAKLITEVEQSVTAARGWKMNTILFQFDEHMKKATLHQQPAKVRPLAMIVALIVFIIFMTVPMFNESDRPAQRCLAILISAIILWVSEAMPLFITALLVAVFVTASYVLLGTDGHAKEPVDAVSSVLGKLYPSSVPLVLAGFSIASAFKKYGLDVSIAHLVIGNRFLRTPHRFVIAVEVLCWFMSCFISNIAASVLTLTVIMPVIRDLPSDCKYIRTLIMATAVAGNIGGMPTQIASPQNAVTVSLGSYSIGFVEFMGCSLPICPFLLATGYFLIIFFFPPDITVLPQLASPESNATTSSGQAVLTLADNKKTQERNAANWLGKAKALPWKAIFTIVITLVSIGLWVASTWLSPLGENIGIISLIPLVLFYGSGLLGKKEFEHEMPWAIISLLGGGSVLGYAVQSSKLLSITADFIGKLPQNIFLLVVICSLVMIIAGTMVSHTVASLILLQLFGEVGAKIGYSKLLVMVACNMSSAAMPLPISSFPNMNAISLQDGEGRPYLNTKDFLKIGILQTICGFLCGISITFGVTMAIFPKTDSSAAITSSMSG